MDAATRLARSREVAGNIMHVPQKRARGVLESCEKRLCRALDAGVNRSHGIKPFVASLPPWSTSHEAVELAQRPPVCDDTRLAPAVRASLDLPRSLSTRPPAGARGELVCVVDRRHFCAFEYPGRKPGRIKLSGLIKLAEAT